MSLQLGCFRAVRQVRIGAGSYGSCILVEDRVGRRYAAKIMYQKREAEREVKFYELLEQCDMGWHPGILRVLYHHFGAPMSWIILPYVRGGALSAWLNGGDSDGPRAAYR